MFIKTVFFKDEKKSCSYFQIGNVFICIYSYGQIFKNFKLKWKESFSPLFTALNIPSSMICPMKVNIDRAVVGGLEESWPDSFAHSHTQ
jgi:hypothetical protein